jgi:hypothetical protein
VVSATWHMGQKPSATSANSLTLALASPPSFEALAKSLVAPVGTDREAGRGLRSSYEIEAERVNDVDDNLDAPTGF